MVITPPFSCDHGNCLSKLQDIICAANGTWPHLPPPGMVVATCTATCTAAERVSGATAWYAAAGDLRALCSPQCPYNTCKWLVQRSGCCHGWPRHCSCAGQSPCTSTPVRLLGWVCAARSQSPRPIWAQAAAGVHCRCRRRPSLCRHEHATSVWRLRGAAPLDGGSSQPSCHRMVS